jgi:hypothetical protein
VLVAGGNMDAASDGAGGALFVGERSSSAYAQRVDEDGNLLWGTIFGVTISEEPPQSQWTQVTSDGIGGAIVAFEKVIAEPLDVNIFAMRVDSTGNPYVSVDVEVLTPNGGEVWYVGSIHDITWAAECLGGVDSVSIYCSVNGGTDYSLVTSGEANDSVYAWTVPGPATDSALVKVVAYDPSQNTGQDESDEVFTIVGISEVPALGFRAQLFATSLILIAAILLLRRARRRRPGGVSV